MRVRIVTPERLLLDTDADMIELPGLGGDLGILPGHAPLVVAIASGGLRVIKDGALTEYAVAGGFAEVLPDHVNILSAFAGGDVEAEDIDAACERARRALEASGTVSEEMIDAELSVLKTSLARLAQAGGRRRPRAS